MLLFNCDYYEDHHYSLRTNLLSSQKWNHYPSKLNQKQFSPNSNTRIYLFLLIGNDALDKAVKSREAPENIKKNSQMSNRVVSFSRNFFKNVQEEIDKIQQKPRQWHYHLSIGSLVWNLEGRNLLPFCSRTEWRKLETYEMVV